MLQVFLNTDLRSFLSTVDEKLKDNLSTDEIVDKVLTFVWLTRESFSPEQIDKFKLYIEYFVEVTKQLARDHR